MIKATDLIKKVDRYITYRSTSDKLRQACFTAAYTLIEPKIDQNLYLSSNLNDREIVNKHRARIDRLTARLEREFLRKDIFEAEENIFYFTLWLHHNPTLREVMQAFREDITFHGNVNINSINEIKKDFKKNYSRTSDIRELFNKGYGAYLVKASFSKGDFEEPSYWDLEIISHYKF